MQIESYTKSCFHYLVCCQYVLEKGHGFETIVCLSDKAVSYPIVTPYRDMFCLLHFVQDKQKRNHVCHQLYFKLDKY